MSQDITKFDPDIIVSKIRGTVRDELLKTIPDELWDKMIKEEINKFFGQKGINRTIEKISEFERIVQQELHNVSVERIKTFLMNNYESYVWEGNEYKVSKEIERIITDNAGRILISVIGQMMQQAVNNARYSNVTFNIT